MSAPDSLALRAVALQLLQDLDLYQDELERMVAQWPCEQAHAAVDARVERMRNLCSALIGLSVPWAEVLIAQAELLQFLCRHADGDAAQASAFRYRLVEAVESLRSRILWRVSREGDFGVPPRPHLL